MNQKLIWALTDGRPGNDNQTIAVAENLANFEVRRIAFGKLAELPNFMLGTSTIGLLTELEAPYPDIVIAAGRKLSRVARIIKKRSGCKIIQLMWPGFGARSFDLIFAPQHDGLRQRRNLIETIGSPNRITPGLLAENAAKWRQHIPVDEKAVTAVLVGDISIDESNRLANIINLMESYPLITTSRRTKPAVIKNLETRITRERYFYEWKAEGENPYLGFMGLANYIIVTGDSLSMCAESCTTGKPVYIYGCKAPKKHRRFTAHLFATGRAVPLKNGNLTAFAYKPLDTLDLVTSKILENLDN